MQSAVLADGQTDGFTIASTALCIANYADALWKESIYSSNLVSLLTSVVMQYFSTSLLDAILRHEKNDILVFRQLFEHSVRLSSIRKKDSHQKIGSIGEHRLDLGVSQRRQISHGDECIAATVQSHLTINLTRSAQQLSTERAVCHSDRQNK